MLKEITVSHIEAKTSSKGTQYRVVTGGDGVKYNIWDAGVTVEEGKTFECEIISNTDPKFHATIKQASPNGHDAKGLEVEMGKAGVPSTDTELRLELLAHAIHHVGDRGVDVVEVARAFEKYVMAG